MNGIKAASPTYGWPSLPGHVAVAWLIWTLLVSGAHAQPLLVHVEESHAGSFYHLVENLPLQEPHTLVLFDAHCDANAIGNSDTIRADIRRGPTPGKRSKMLAQWRQEGRIQCFNWLESLMPSPITEVIWVPAIKLEAAEAQRLEKDAREYLDAHEEALPRDAGPLSSRYRVMDLESLKKESSAWPGSRRVVASVDLDFFAKTADESLAYELEQVLSSVLRLRGLVDITVAISSPYLKDAAQAEKLTTLALDAVWRVPGAKVEFEPFARTGPDRSLMARLLERQGKQLPALDLAKAGPELRTLLLAHWKPKDCMFESEKALKLWMDWSADPFRPHLEVRRATRRPDGTWGTVADGDLSLHVKPDPVGSRVRWMALQAKGKRYRLGDSDLGFASDAPRWITHEAICLQEDPAMPSLSQISLGKVLDPALHCGTVEIYAEVIREGQTWRTPSQIICVHAKGTEGARATWSEQFGLPYVFDSRLLRRGAWSGPETRWGADCANFITHGLRMEGWRLPWGSPRDVEPYLQPLTNIVSGKEVLLHFGSHLAALWEDLPPVGTLDDGDLCVHQLEGTPELLSLAKLSAGRPKPRLMQLRPPKKPIRLVFAGDVMLGRKVGTVIAQHKNPMEALQPIFAGADLVMGNLECVISDQAPELARELLTLVAPPKAVEYLHDSGFTALSLANNHASDLGMPGREATKRHLESAGVKPLFNEPVIMQARDRKLALLAWDDSAEADDALILDKVRLASAQADFVIVMPHWGTEHQVNPTERQRLLAKRFLEAGADLIVGSGPHVVQRVDHGPGGSVAYSLGNTVFDGPGPDAEWSRGALLEVILESEGTLRIVRARLLPTTCDQSGIVKLE